MNGHVLYPRLPNHLARQLAESHSRAGVAELREFAQHAGQDLKRFATYRATGGDRVTSDRVSGVCEAILESARSHGYPDRLDDRVAADADIAVALHERMEIVPSDAAHPGVWAYLACVELPDVVAWRYRGDHDETTAARFTGGVRNTLGRLWWRAQTVRSPLDPDPYALLRAGLSEDNWVQIMERPGLYGYARLARCVVGTHVAVRSSTQRRQDVMRDACKRLGRIRSVACFEVLDDDRLSRLVRQCFDEAVAAVGAPTIPSV